MKSILLSILFLLTSNISGDDSKISQKIHFKKIADGFKEITDIQFLPEDDNSMIVLEKSGTGLILSISTGRKHSFLKLRDKVNTSSEEGLLGFAFHPKFTKNGLFYANYVVRENGKDFTIIAEFFSKSKKLTEELSEPKNILLKIEQPYSNHNAGQLAFGNDGFLYIGLGDGGSGGDPLGHGQNTKTMLGSMLRIDVDKKESNLPYKIPTDNPFLKDPNFLPEIYAYGLRNPWRYSFDRQTGRLFLADVGQNLYEEINIIEKGKNYGWNIREGLHCFKKNPKCSEKFSDPIHEYSHSDGQSITGGYVYRGKNIPELQGGYIYGDFVTGKIWVLFVKDSRKKENALLMDTNFLISTFGQNSKGEVFFSDFSDGGIYQLTK